MSDNVSSPDDFEGACSFFAKYGNVTHNAEQLKVTCPSTSQLCDACSSAIAQNRAPVVVVIRAAIAIDRHWRGDQPKSPWDHEK